MFQKWLHRLFDFGIILKGLDGLLQALGGMVLLLLKPEQIGNVLKSIALRELHEDSRDLIASYLFKLGTGVTPHSKFVSVVFLLSHGLIKIFLVWQLFRGKLWAYPLTIVVLLLFMIYQTVEIVRMHSPLLTVITVLDALLVWLTWHEYRMKLRMKR